MPIHIQRRLAATVSAGALAITAACHHATARVAPEAGTMFAQAMRDFRRGRFDKAQQGFQRIQFELGARDTMMIRVHFFLAETFAAQGELVTAAREFRRVSDDFPSDALAPQALLRAGDQYGLLWRRPELDPTNGETALATYQELMGRYPETHAAQLARVRIRELEDRYALKDFQNGLFYFKRSGFDSAILYFRALIAKYPGSSVVPDAYVKLVEAYTAIGYHEERDETCAHLRQYFGGRPDVRRVCGDGSTGR